MTKLGEMGYWPHMRCIHELTFLWLCVKMTFKVICRWFLDVAMMSVELPSLTSSTSKVTLRGEHRDCPLKARDFGRCC
jgi:hypothetical protein